MLAVADKKEFILQLQLWGAIPTEVACIKCSKPMTLKKTDRNSLMNFKWYCGKKDGTVGKRCYYSSSLSGGTFFSGGNKPMQTILEFINLWVDNISYKVIRKQIGGVGPSDKFFALWGQKCRTVIFNHMVTHGEPIGGLGVTVEIDESKFGKRKYNKGRAVEGQWVFGGVDRSTGEVFAVPVDKRDAATLIPIIQRWIKPGTTIISDCWRAYNSLTELGYIHLTVNHSENYVDPITGAHTNRIESTWRAIKSDYKSSGRRKKYFASYMAVYMFRKHCKLRNIDPFTEFLRICSIPANLLSTNAFDAEDYDSATNASSGEEDNASTSYD